MLPKRGMENDTCLSREVCADAQRCWYSSQGCSASSSTGLASLEIIFWISFQGYLSSGIPYGSTTACLSPFLIGTQFCLCHKENLVPPLNRCSALSFLALQQHCRQWSGSRASSPQGYPLPRAPAMEQRPGLHHPAHPNPSFTPKALFASFSGAAGFTLLCFLWFSTPGEIYCCKAPWAHWQGKTITQHFQSQKSVIVIYMCATFQQSYGLSLIFPIRHCCLDAPCPVHPADVAVSGLLHFEITLHIQTQVRDLGLRHNMQWINHHQYFSSLEYNYIHIT